MSRETVLTAVRDLVLAWSPLASGLTQLSRGFAYPYDKVPNQLPSFPVVIVERNRAKSAFSDSLGRNATGGSTREQLLPIRIDVAYQLYDPDQPNINQATETAVLAWEDELHALFAADPKIGGAVIKLGEVNAPRRVETKIGWRYWFDQQLFGAAAFIDALYEVST